LVFSLTGNFPWSQVPGYLVAQFLGAMIGAFAVYLLYLPHWKETVDPKVKLGIFATGPAIPHTFSNLLCEMLATFILVLGLLTIGANQFTDGLHPLIIGLLITTLCVALGGPTGAAMNPARDLGPRIAHFLLPISGKGKSNWGYAWIPVAGPIIGGTIGGFFYNAAFLGRMIPQLFVALGIGVVVLIASYFLGIKTGKQKEFKQKPAVIPERRAN
jgi:glycerol uptake facilitator protein